MSERTLETMKRNGARPILVPVWDLLVRTGHWLLVVLFFVAYFTEEDLLTVHSWAGYGVAAYVVIRVIWGFVGSKHARFADFAYGPASTLHYLKGLLTFHAKRYIGHSPAGAAMVFALLVSLAVTTVSGMAVLAVEENAGPLAPWLGREAAAHGTEPGVPLLAAPARASDDEHEQKKGTGGEALEEIHELFSSLTLVLIVLHIGGVVLASIVHRENLARAMVTGRKRAE
jgi:cytochrome b